MGTEAGVGAGEGVVLMGIAEAQVWRSRAAAAAKLTEACQRLQFGQMGQDERAAVLKVLLEMMLNKNGGIDHTQYIIHSGTYRTLLQMLKYAEKYENLVKLGLLRALHQMIINMPHNFVEETRRLLLSAHWSVLLALCNDPHENIRLEAVGIVGDVGISLENNCKQAVLDSGAVRLLVE
ncbi:hypothetical protein B484DRAFT_397222, partial [Ochromonadaceae sp. CCMP2298]